LTGYYIVDRFFHGLYRASTEQGMVKSHASFGSCDPDIADYARMLKRVRIGVCIIKTATVGMRGLGSGD
jgi:hypothetical protein